MESVVENLNQWHMQSFERVIGPKSLNNFGKGTVSIIKKCVQVNNFT